MNSLSAETALHGDVLCRVLTFLEWREIVKLRIVSDSWRQAATAAPVEEEIYVDEGSTLRGILRCLPKVQSLRMDQNTQYEALAIVCSPRVMSASFSNLRSFKCLHTPSVPDPLGFRETIPQWQNLRSLNLHGNEEFHWELSDLAPLGQLQDIRCINNHCLTGDVQDLLSQHETNGRTARSFRQTLVILDISGCNRVTGNLRDFCHLLRLEWLGIARTQITGDLRTDIRPGDFKSLQGMGLDNAKVYGAFQIDSVRDAPAVMRARDQILRQSTWESPFYPLMVHLSPESSEYHERVEQRLYTSERDPPFDLETVVVGGRRGWRWSNYLGGFCDTHWLDPEPIDCRIYQKEFADFQLEQETSFFSGFKDPPSPEEYRALCLERGI